MKIFLIRLVGALLSTDAIHSYVFLSALAGLWYGIDQWSRPAGIIAISSILLGLVIYARTRKAG